MLAGVATLEFCMAWTIVVRSLFYLRGLTRKIQGRNLDLLDFVGQVEVAHEDLAFIPNYGAKEYFSRFFEYAVEMASLIAIVPSIPRIPSRQQHRKEHMYFNYFRKNMCLSFLDHLINGIDVRFDKYGKTALMMQALIPSVIAE